jgi:hypothetical protein
MKAYLAALILKSRWSLRLQSKCVCDVAYASTIQRVGGGGALIMKEGVDKQAAFLDGQANDQQHLIGRLLLLVGR